MNETTTGKLAADFKILIDDVEELVKATADQAGERIGNLRQQLQKKVADGRRALAKREFDWFEKAPDVKKEAESPPPENTWTAGDCQRNRYTARLASASAPNAN
jgi:ElaB/YqjD/DUF883 family membrane-anchored ribosome-binding protein